MTAMGISFGNEIRGDKTRPNEITWYTRTSVRTYITTHIPGISSSYSRLAAVWILTIPSGASWDQRWDWRRGAAEEASRVGGNLFQRGENIVETSVLISRGEGSSHAAVPDRPDLPREHDTREVSCKFSTSLTNEKTIKLVSPSAFCHAFNNRDLQCARKKKTGLWIDVPLCIS